MDDTARSGGTIKQNAKPRGQSANALLSLYYARDLFSLMCVTNGDSSSILIPSGLFLYNEFTPVYAMSLRLTADMLKESF